MNLWRTGFFLAVAAALIAQMPFRQYPGVEYGDFPLPADYREKTEWVFARLMYPPTRYGIGGGYGFRGSANWAQGFSIWTQDYPRADRHFSEAVRRLTRLHVRSVEQPVNLDDGDDVFNWPWLAAGEMGDWLLTDAQAANLRDYLLRGGFLYLDDFWGPDEFASFNETMSRVFPDREIVEIDNKDQIFHVVYDLDDRYQILGEWALGGRGRGGMGNRVAGTHAEWKGIYDDHNRLMVAMSFNSDVGDSWEWADDPGYPERYSALGIRVGVNYVIYSMTH